MMKKFAGVFCCLTVLVASTYSQYRHQFGAITAADVEMKQCPFDPEAGAVMLVNEGYSDYDDSHHLITLIHRRIKILSEKGMSNANVTIYYQSDDDYESVDNIEAVTINTDEHNQRTEYPVDRKSIFTKKKSQYFSESTFAFSNVKVGSFLEYRFRNTKRYGSALSNWNFQEHIPVCYSSFELHPAPTLEFTYQVQKSPKYPVVIKPSPLSNTTYFEMDSLPGLDDEPYMDARNDYIQRVNFTVTKFEGMAGAQRYMDDWNQVARQLWGEPYFGAEIKANLKEPHDMIAVAAGGKTDLEKMKLIYDFVRNNVEWNRVYSHVAFDGVRTAWNKKSGTSGSVNLLLVNLLRDAGLDVYPMLVSDRSNGHVNTKTPFVNQFNNVYAFVKVDGKNYYLDATNRYTSVNLVPDDILNTTALVVKNKTGELLDIIEPEKKYREVVYFSANLSEDGKLSSSVQTVSKDYAKQYRERRFNAGDKADYIEHVLKQGLANVAIDSLEVEGDKNDSSDFIQRFRVAANVSSTGDYSFLGLNMFSGFEKNPFVSNNRFSDVNFGYMQNINLVWLVKVPEKWTIDALPKSLKMVNQDRTVVFSREITYNKELSQINARIKIDLNKSLYGLDEYADLKEFFKKMTGLLDEQIVFKTK